jgi:hypothetical protein
MPKAQGPSDKPEKGARSATIVVAVITILGSIAVAVIAKLPGIELSRPKAATFCDVQSDLHWTVAAGDWTYYGGLVRFGALKGSSGLLIGATELTEGSIESTVKLPKYKEGCKAQLAYSFKPTSEGYFTAGLGGARAAYSMGEYRPGVGWNQLIKRGDGGSLSESQVYKIRLELAGDLATLNINDVKIAQVVREKGASPSVVGIWVEDCEAAEFICTKVCPK